MRAGFDWDNRKAQKNARKHGVEFEESSSVFGDPLAITFPDPDHSENEPRMIILGMSLLGRMLLTVYVEHAATIRIISSRKATRSERKAYEEGESH
jgi:hypothetical protein